jgi:choline/glycine/proline betaine transport protein
MFYWGWWIAWSPFVGMFIARVSRGRTIREFIVGVLFVPTGATFVWLATFGGLALHTELFAGGGLVEAVQTDVALALYVALEGLPLSTIVAGLATLLIVTYFVTSSDSGSLVIDIIAAGGATQTARGTRIFWAISEGMVAAALLLAGGLAALQTASIVAGLPFAVIMVFVCFGLGRALRQDPEMEDPKASGKSKTE